METKIKIITCNIRSADADDGENNWKFRKNITLEIIKSTNSDIICFQEMTKVQYDFFSSELNEFSCLAPLEAPGNSNPANSIFFRTDRFFIVSSGSYWLSKTPYVAGTKSWGCQFPRMVNWGRFKIEDKEFRIINTHLSHVSKTARLKETQMILNDVAVYTEKYPQILTGDFNCNSKSKPISLVLRSGLQDTYSTVHRVLEPETTIHNFLGQKTPNVEGKIDWIFTKGEITTLDSNIVKNSINEKYPSDHYFLTADVVIWGKN